MTTKQEKGDYQIDCSGCLYYCDEAKKPQCRHNTPTRRAVTNGWQDGWPTVKETDWCGEWTGIDEDGSIITFEEVAVDIETAEEDKGDGAEEGDEEADDAEGD